MRHAVLHELAHAWADHALEDHARDAFMAARGASNWNDRTELWHDRGVEQAMVFLRMFKAQREELTDALDEARGLH